MKAKKWLWVVGILAMVFFVIPMLITAFLYNRVFGKRVDNDSHYYDYLFGQYPDFKRTPYRFISDRGQELQGYFYYYSPKTPAGLIVIAHGMGGGHDSYLAEAEYLAREGYLVYAYDNTGTNESEGKNLKGLSQSAIDLHYALSALEGIPALSDYPILLYGHSWGGFAVTAVNHYPHRVKAIVSVSGFENNTAVFRQQGQVMVGRAISLFMPYVKLYEYLLFGSDATHRGISGLQNTDASVLILHSKDDTIVDYEDNFMKYAEAFSDDPRFTLLSLNDHGHNAVLSPNVNEEIKKIREQKALYPEVSEEYLALAEREKTLLKELDLKVMEEIVSFFNRHSKGETP